MAIPLKVEYYPEVNQIQARLKGISARMLKDKSKENKYIYQARGGYAMVQRNRNGSFTLTLYKTCPCG